MYPVIYKQSAYFYYITDAAGILKRSISLISRSGTNQKALQVQNKNQFQRDLLTTPDHLMRHNQFFLITARESD